MYVERWTGGLVKPHTFFEFDDERIDGGTANKTTSLAVSSSLVRFSSTAAVILLTFNSICLKLQCSLRQFPCCQYVHIVSQPRADGSCLYGQKSPCENKNDKM
ncbi:hypothetical protein ALC60_06661 [Trachymyrmex zeteki]|uniref:Uncharacterized protein n=1 Tax=Mycetomoellerius zeteki TaxID=64791 RepID=A0A151X2T3_9HYME|nr:hypothetical protein ALC60_06661 [Trachymyrmex zeteki]